MENNHQPSAEEAEDKTIGQLLKEAIQLHELNPDVIERQLKFPSGILTRLMNDDYYTNSVPVVLFKNLIVSLHIPFTKIDKAMMPTFKLVLSKETPESIKKKPAGYTLWENEESVLKYTKHLKEIIFGQAEEAAKRYAENNYDPEYSGYETWIKPFLAGYQASKQGEAGMKEALDKELCSNSSFGSCDFKY